MAESLEPVIEREVAGIPVQAVACPLCGTSGGKSWGRENGFNALKCEGCALVYVSPRPADSQISEATKAGQHRGEAQALSFVYARSERKIARYGARVRDALGDKLPKEPVSWLDIGAGFGELIEALQQLLPPGSEIVGVEPMGPKAEHARARGLPISSAALGSIGREFDYVSMVNVLSHLPDPAGFLAEVRPLVKPGGTLLLVTGNGGDLDSARDYPDRLDLPDHLVFAGQEHVRRFLDAAGFDLYRTRATRLDTATWSAKLLVKKLLGQPVPLAIPYRSAFRDMLYLARRRA